MPDPTEKPTARDRAIGELIDVFVSGSTGEVAAWHLAGAAVDALLAHPDLLRELAGPFGWCTWCGGTVSVQADGLIAPHDAVSSACSGSETKDYRTLYEPAVVPASISLLPAPVETPEQQP
ncbi:hypothetical protein [Pseudonocardia sp.]|uniref:hypothetical protein n=1 Tax=Pseudonocardia sp. TaxID=60912 RepID=UPI00261B856B|nr:hypothetical protein [Pseudonocardia sp.]MCW2721360.1 hypothetical protein [Pseudonocardia sp.]